MNWNKFAPNRTDLLFSLPPNLYLHVVGVDILGLVIFNVLFFLAMAVVNAWTDL